MTRFEECFAYSLSEKLIVFQSESASLHFLDELSAWLFLSLDAGLSETDLKKELCESQLNPILLDQAFEKIDVLLSPEKIDTSYQQEYETLIATPVLAPDKLTAIVSLSLLGKTFHLYSDCQQFESYLLTLSLAKLPICEIGADYHVVISTINNSYQLSCNNVPIYTIDKFEYIMPILMDHLQILAYQSSDYLLAVHSAMLEVNGKGLMLPGQSGSGKSTLAVSLLSHGYHCYSDEIAVISADDNQLMPIPLPAAIKSGSWRVIKQSFPNINLLPVWARSDGRHSKYIDLPHNYHPLPNTPLACIIFPHYEANFSGCKLIEIDPVSVLEQLTLAGYQIKNNLTQEKVEQILQWISSIPAYHLHYANLDDAHQYINELMAFL